LAFFKTEKFVGIGKAFIMAYSVKTSSTNFQNKTHLKEFCSIFKALDFIGGRWKVNILAYLFEHDSLRFKELKRLLEGISERMLSAKLKELESDGLITKETFPEVPPRVEYKLTEFGRTLRPVLESLNEWGKATNSSK